MAELDPAPLIDLSDTKLSDLMKEVDTNTDMAQYLRRAMQRIVQDLKDPDAVISAFGSYAGV